MKTVILVFSVLFTATTFAQAPNYVPANGLVGWWPFNGNANDESGNTNNGTNNGATLTTDRNGVANQAYSFDGIDDYIDISHNNSLSFPSYQNTISFWLKFPFIPQPINIEAVMSKYSGIGNTLQGFTIHFAGNSNLFYSIKNGSGFNWGDCYIETSNYQIPNTFYHFVYTNNNDSIICFVNGIKISSIQIPVGTNIGTNTSALVFGKENDMTGGVNFYNGVMDDIGIWDRALTDCEIKDLYNSQLGSNNSSSNQSQTALDSYTWPINNQTYIQSGIYTATIPNAAGCDSVITLNLTLNYTGINEQNGNSLTLSPNPTSSKITIKSSLVLIGKEYIIYDQLGKVVKSGVITSEETEIDLSNLTEGVYLFKAGAEMQETFKIIKQ